jgi:hypothetical protein
VTNDFVWPAAGGAQGFTTISFSYQPRFERWFFSVPPTYRTFRPGPYRHKYRPRPSPRPVVRRFHRSAIIR